MRKKFLSLVLCLLIPCMFCFSACDANETENLAIDISQYEGLPLVSINTQNNEKIDSNENYVNASFEITNSTIFNGTDFSVSMKDSVEEDDSVGIRLRGNSTLSFPKKAYRIKFDKKQSLFGLEKNKSWVLLADYIDQSSIRNYACFKFADSLDNISFAVTPHHVVLSINGYYRGLYLLCEQVDDNKGRTNVKEDFAYEDESYPFLVEMVNISNIEGTLGKDYFVIENNYYPVEIKYPEYDERCIPTADSEDVVFNYIKDYMSAVFTTLKTGNSVQFGDKTVVFEDLVDVESFIDYFFVNEIFHNPDANWKNIFMHKTKDGKLKMGPNWDFDLSCTNLWIGNPYNETNTILETADSFCCFNAGNSMMYDFLKKQENYDLVCTRWNEIKGNILDLTVELMDYKNTIKKAVEFDSLYWYGPTGVKQHNEQYQFVISFLIKKYAFLNRTLVPGDNIFNNV